VFSLDCIKGSEEWRDEESRGKGARGRIKNYLLSFPSAPCSLPLCLLPMPMKIK